MGDYLEHSRMFYFHQAGNPKVYAGSADMMVRSFDRRIEALFLIVNPQLKREAINVLHFNLKDNQNTYVMREDGAYIHRQPAADEPVFNVHKEFYSKNFSMAPENALYEEWLSCAAIRKEASADVAEAAPSVPADDQPNSPETEAESIVVEVAEGNPETEADLA